MTPRIELQAMPAVTAATVLALAIAVCGCDGSVAPLPGAGNGTTNDGGAPLPSAEDGGVRLLSNDPNCPRDIPPLPTGPTSPGGAAIGGTSCSGSAACEYGTNSANPACNTILECVSRRGSCNGVDDCKQSDADRVWSTAYSPYGSDPVRCQDALQLQVPPSTSDCPKVRPPIGQSCTETDANCMYSTCNGATACSSGCFWVVADCVDGFWNAGSANLLCGQEPKGN